MSFWFLKIRFKSFSLFNCFHVKNMMPINVLILWQKSVSILIFNAISILLLFLYQWEQTVALCKRTYPHAVKHSGFTQRLPRATGVRAYEALVPPVKTRLSCPWHGGERVMWGAGWKPCKSHEPRWAGRWLNMFQRRESLTKAGREEVREKSSQNEKESVPKPLHEFSVYFFSQSHQKGQ